MLCIKPVSHCWLLHKGVFSWPPPESCNSSNSTDCNSLCLTVSHRHTSRTQRWCGMLRQDEHPAGLLSAVTLLMKHAGQPGISALLACGQTVYILLAVAFALRVGIFLRYTAAGCGLVTARWVAPVSIQCCCCSWLCAYLEVPALKKASVSAIIVIATVRSQHL